MALGEKIDSLLQLALARRGLEALDTLAYSNCSDYLYIYSLEAWRARDELVFLPGRPRVRGPGTGC